MPDLFSNQAYFSQQIINITTKLKSFIFEQQF